MIALLGARLCDPAQGWDGPADVYLTPAGVAAVRPAGGPAPAGTWTRWECRGRLLVPGPVDTLCRLDLGRDPWREDAHTLAEAAAAGGYTGLVVHTGSADPAAIAALTELRLPVRLHPVAALTLGGRLADLGALADAGAVAFSDWPHAALGSGLMRHALEYAAWLGRPVVAAAEDPGLAAGGVMHEGALSFALGLRGIPAAAEAAAVQRDAMLQRTFGGRLHFAALSCADALPLLGEATAGVTAHHLALTQDAVRGYDTAAKLAPPLRAERDRQALLAAAEGGRLILASGHDPCPAQDKTCEYDYAAFGATAIETALPLALASLSPAAFARAIGAGPAAAFGLASGSLAPGAPADVALFDLDAPWTVEPVALRSRGRATPLRGWTLRARAVGTVVGGRPASGLRP